jgi:transcriptional regulator with XRE-family HTH domain
MGRKYKSVSEVVKNLTDDKKFHEDFKNQVFDKMLSKTLFAMRCSKGITQAEMAEKLNCTQSRVSKLEHSGLDAIKVSDLVSYAQALGLKMSIAFHEEMTSVESVKFHAFEIKKHLDHLADLAHRDDDIFEGVKDFYNEYLLNILRLFKQSETKLAKKKPQKRDILEVSAPTEIPDEKVLLGT